MNAKKAPYVERTPKQIEAYLHRQAKRRPMGDCIRPSLSREQEAPLVSLIESAK